MKAQAPRSALPAPRRIARVAAARVRELAYRRSRILPYAYVAGDAIARRKSGRRMRVLCSVSAAHARRVYGAAPRSALRSMPPALRGAAPRVAHVCHLLIVVDACVDEKERITIWRQMPRLGGW